MSGKSANTLGRLQKFAAAMPDEPGIYKLKDASGTVLYIGKAKNLKHRVKTYFQKGSQHSTRIRKLLEKTKDLEYVVTDSELEAYVLETNLIKELRPRYNIMMKDDKNFVYIKINVKEDFPRISIVRKIEKDGAKYIGPKTGSTKVYELFRVLKKLFPFRHCGLHIDFIGGSGEKSVKVTNKIIDYPCLDYFIKRCQGPCVGAVQPEEYRAVISQIIDFLEGRGEELIKKLKMQMAEAAKKRQFELAARTRDKLFTVEEIMEKQKVSDPERQDTDIINFHIEMGRIYVNIFLIRGGKLIRHENFILDAFEIEKSGDVSSSEILEAFLQSYYEKSADIPKEILIPESIEGQTVLETWISHMRPEDGKVKILVPQKGEKNKLLELSRKNAEIYAKQYRIKFLAEQAEKQAVADLAAALQLIDGKTGEALELRRIECYDISHFGGEHTVGSMVVFEKGFPKREHYRHFKLRTVDGKPNDFASIKEILLRRLKYLEPKNPSITIKAPTKKEFKNISAKEADKKDFLVVNEGKRMIGFGSIKKLDEKKALLENFRFVSVKKEKHPCGYKLLKKLIDRSRAKRIYRIDKKSAGELYAAFGFTEVKEIPEMLRKKIKKDCVCFVYDVKKQKLDPSFISKPQLLVVDGGKPQITAAVEALKRFNLEIPVCSLAKRLEEIYIPGAKAPLLLEEGEAALKLLQRLRDEAHRFAIEFQRDLKRKHVVSA